MEMGILERTEDTYYIADPFFHYYVVHYTN